MNPRNELHSRERDYLKMRRCAIVLMGFCPSCSNSLDTFPQMECSSCQNKKKLRILKLKNERDKNAT